MSLQLPTDVAVRSSGGSRLTVVNVMAHGPGYGLLSDQRHFLQSWETPSGAQVGIVNREWPGDLGHWVLPQSSRFRWEVWQPDTRANRIYTHKFADGVTHRLFPARARTFWPGVFRPVPGVESARLIQALEALDNSLLVLHGFEAPWWRELTPHFDHRIPTLVVAHGTARPPADRLRRARHPLTPAALIVRPTPPPPPYPALPAIPPPNYP